jgi:hypothetical protein
VELWIPLAFLVVAAAGSLVWAALRGWRLWRTFRAVSRRTTHALGRVAEKGAAVEERALALSGNAERLGSAAERLRAALAELTVLRAAYAESRGAYRSIRGAVPRK